MKDNNNYTNYELNSNMYYNSKRVMYLLLLFYTLQNELQMNKLNGTKNINIIKYLCILYLSS